MRYAQEAPIIRSTSVKGKPQSAHSSEPTQFNDTRTSGGVSRELQVHR